MSHWTAAQKSTPEKQEARRYTDPGTEIHRCYTRATFSQEISGEIQGSFERGAAQKGQVEEVSAQLSPLRARPRDTRCLPFADGTGHNSNQDKHAAFLWGDGG